MTGHMQDDIWKAFKQYSNQSRQSQREQEYHLSEEKERKKKEAEALQLQAELARRQSEQRQSEQHRVMETQASEKRYTDEAARQAVFAQIAESLRTADQQRNEAQQAALLKVKEAQRSLSSGSPIEEVFYNVWSATYPDIILHRQHPIGKYRVDFTHVESMTAIELDGQRFHSTRRDRTRDYQRQRLIEDQGWKFVRFTGSEVFHDVVNCVTITAQRILEHMAR